MMVFEVEVGPGLFTCKTGWQIVGLPKNLWVLHSRWNDLQFSVLFFCTNQLKIWLIKGKKWLEPKIGDSSTWLVRPILRQTKPFLSALNFLHSHPLWESKLFPTHDPLFSVRRQVFFTRMCRVKSLSAKKNGRKCGRKLTQTTLRIKNIWVRRNPARVRTGLGWSRPQGYSRVATPQVSARIRRPDFLQTEACVAVQLSWCLDAAGPKIFLGFINCALFKTWSSHYNFQI